MEVEKQSLLAKKLNDIETKYDVSELQISGIYIWPLIKIKITFENWGNNSSITHNQPRFVTELIQPFFNHLKVKMIDFMNEDKIRKVDVLILSDSINRRVRDTSGRWFDIFTDCIATRLNEKNLSWLSLERFPNNTTKLPRASKSFSLVFLLIKHRFLFNIRRRLSKSKYHHPTLNKIKTELSDLGFGVNSIDSLSANVFYLKTLSEYYKKILAKARPKVVLQTDWYSMSSIALGLACREIGIPYGDIQHGVQGEDHVAYGGWKKPFSNGLSIFPDFFLCWSDHDVAAISQWLPESKGKAYNCGNLFLNDSISGKIEVLGQKNNLEFIKQSLHDKFSVLITLQPAYGLSDEIVEQIKIYSGNCFFWIRLHPTMLSNIEEINLTASKILKENEFNILQASTFPLPLILQHTDVHLTINSSTVLEAETLGVPSVILDHKLGPGLYRFSISNGHSVIGPTEAKPKKFSPSYLEFQPLLNCLKDYL